MKTLLGKAAAWTLMLLATSAGAQCTFQWYNPFPSSLSPGGWCADLTYFDDGAGPALWALAPTGSPTLKRFSANTWTSFGPVVNGASKMTNFAGSIYVGGTFSLIGTTNYNNMARWNGTA